MRSPTSRRSSSSPADKRAEVLDRYEDGGPHPVRIAAKVLALDEQVLEYSWGMRPAREAERTRQQYAEHVEYRLRLTTRARPPW